MFVDLDLFKQHIRADFDGEDGYLLHLLTAAEEYVLKATNRPLEELTATEGAVPADLIHATLLIAGHWYNQRESVSGVQMHEVPGTLQALLKPYRKLSEK